jgi:hypothetical protein
MRQEQRKANLQRLRHPVSTVDVFIDELILHGFSPADRYIVGDAFGHELGQLFENRESSISLIKEPHVPELNAGRIILPSNVKPVSVGIQVAQAVYRSLNNTHRGNQR